MPFVKIRFTSVRHGATAGLVIPSKQLADSTVAELSRLYPCSEASKMERLEISIEYATQEDALQHLFEIPGPQRMHCAQRLGAAT